MKKYKSSVTYSNSQVGNQLTNERTCVIYIYNSLIYLNFRVSFVMEIKLEMDIKDIVCVSNMNRKWDEEYSSIDCCLEYIRYLKIIRYLCITVFSLNKGLVFGKRWWWRRKRKIFRMRYIQCALTECEKENFQSIYRHVFECLKIHTIGNSDKISFLRLLLILHYIPSTFSILFKWVVFVLIENFEILKMRFYSE